jgi:hypothetical protein
VVSCCNAHDLMHVNVVYLRDKINYNGMQILRLGPPWLSKFKSS